MKTNFGIIVLAGLGFLGMTTIGIAQKGGPFTPQPEAIKGSFSIDPAVYKDTDGAHYMYFGGLWGGQLQRWRKGSFNAEIPDSPTAHIPADNEPALLPFVAKMTDDLLEFTETPKPLEILDEQGNLLLAGDHDRRFFEAAWLHHHNGTYYFSYSTGDTHFICYATGNNPYGPFTFRTCGRLDLTSFYL